LRGNLADRGVAELILRSFILPVIYILTSPFLSIRDESLFQKDDWSYVFDNPEALLEFKIGCNFVFPIICF
jgi:hypothetical protein